MSDSAYIRSKFEAIGGEFPQDIEGLAQNLIGNRAWIFDWDGVFNKGHKGGTLFSTFSEVDSMGINMLRFSHFLQHGALPFTAIISGEYNPAAEQLAKREHYNAVFFKYRNKVEAVDQICSENRLKNAEIGFFFDDILDLSVAERCGIRIQADRLAGQLFTQYVRDNKLADYISASTGGNHAVREACEMLIGLRGNWEQCIRDRVRFTGPYSDYLEMRNTIETQVYGKE
ncbi:MAG: phosphatase [Bacteroidota bacterium]